MSAAGIAAAGPEAGSLEEACSVGSVVQMMVAYQEASLHHNWALKQVAAQAVQQQHLVLAEEPA